MIQNFVKMDISNSDAFISDCSGIDSNDMDEFDAIKCRTMEQEKSSSEKISGAY